MSGKDTKAMKVTQECLIISNLRGHSEAKSRLKPLPKVGAWAVVGGSWEGMSKHLKYPS